MGRSIGTGKSGALVSFQGDVYKPTVTQVMERDDDGRPRALRIVYDDEEVSTEHEPEFIIGLFRPKVLKPQPKKSN